MTMQTMAEQKIAKLQAQLREYAAKNRTLSLAYSDGIAFAQLECANELEAILTALRNGEEREKQAARDPAYDRDLIAEMLDAYEAHKDCDTDLVHLESSIREQARLLREADEADAARVGTVCAPLAPAHDVSIPPPEIDALPGCVDAVAARPLAIPDAASFLDNMKPIPGVASRDWQRGWDACKAHFPARGAAPAPEAAPVTLAEALALQELDEVLGRLKTQLQCSEAPFDWKIVNDHYRAFCGIAIRIRKRIRHATPAPAPEARPVAVDPALIEVAAKAIFEHWNFGAPVAWVPRGNSLKQTEARAYAREAIEAIAPLYAAPAVPEVDDAMVERAMEVFWEGESIDPYLLKREKRAMRAALTAALNPEAP